MEMDADRVDSRRWVRLALWCGLPVDQLERCGLDAWYCWGAALIALFAVAEIVLVIYKQYIISVSYQLISKQDC